MLDKYWHESGYRWLTVVALAVATAGLAIEYGFGVTEGRAYFHTCELAAALVLLSAKVCRWAFGRMELRGVAGDFLLFASFLVGLCVVPYVFEHSDGIWAVRWGMFQIYLLLVVVAHIGRFSVAASGRAPMRALLGSFVVIILTGAILLMLPGAHCNTDLCFTDAVFTATSATCVTGLVVRDTGVDFTVLGQSIILAMIQIGGLGIMMFGALFSLIMGSRLTLRESVAMQDIMHEQSSGRVGRVVIFVCLFTVVVEFFGVLGCYGMWESDGGGGQLFRSAFHSVSAFCNAGFSLQSDSLMTYRSDWRVYCVIAPMIIIGGLGFPVLDNLGAVVLSRWRWRRHRDMAVRVRLSLHSKVVLSTTAVLLILGWVLLGVLEGGLSDAWAWVDGWFNSVTSRTAGFNTVEISKLSSASKLVMVALMSIGGSPSSTAGGIKTVTLAVMVLAVYATMRHREQIEAFHRRIPVMIARRASMVMLLYGLLLWLLTLLLTITEAGGGSGGGSYDVLDLLFEASSALGTVGLSTGVTGSLTLSGKWVIIAAMFIGRLGPLSLLMALASRSGQAKYDYPAEPLVVG